MVRSAFERCTLYGHAVLLSSHPLRRSPAGNHLTALTCGNVDIIMLSFLALTLVYHERSPGDSVDDSDHESNALTCGNVDITVISRMRFGLRSTQFWAR